MVDVASETTYELPCLVFFEKVNIKFYEDFVYVCFYVDCKFLLEKLHSSKPKERKNSFQKN